MKNKIDERISNAIYNTLHEITPMLSLHDLRELQRILY